MSMRALRVALCQIESHPAVSSGHVAYTEEPFVPLPNGPSLSQISAKGINVQALQEHCSMEYAGIVKLTLSEQPYRVELTSFALIGRHRLPPARR